MANDGELQGCYSHPSFSGHFPDAYWIAVTSRAAFNRAAETGRGRGSAAARRRHRYLRFAVAERKTTFALEVARCYEQRRDDPGVFLYLVNAEASGPEDAILQPPKPSINPSKRILERIAERDLDREAAD